MYTVLKCGSEIYVRRWMKLGNGNPNCVLFLASSRKPEGWSPLVVSSQDLNARYPRLDRYIRGLPAHEQEKWRKFETNLCSIAKNNKQILDQKAATIFHREAAKFLNESFLDGLGRTFEKDYFVAATASRYQNICWKCSKSVDSNDDLKHRQCGWLICGRCGACGCGYEAWDD